MGLFGWLTGNKDEVEVGKERIWLTHAAKWAGIRGEAAQAIADPAAPGAVILVAHFNDCLEQLRTAVAGLDQDRIVITLADALARRMPTDLVGDPSCSVLVIVGERHPLPSHNEVVADFTRQEPDRCLLIYHSSLEDPVMKRFAGPWVEDVLRRMGMKEDEPIMSRMVTRRIRQALEKIAKSATGDAPAQSAVEWMERNCP
jgi:hypothetical protein